MAEENSGPSFFTGLLLGTIIGAVLGLVFAPQPGEKTREQLRSKADEFISLGKSAWEEGKEAAG
ncbi:MAG: YtxH domain-containing protein, partial [Dehalococcoidia bacterium]